MLMLYEQKAVRRRAFGRLPHIDAPILYGIVELLAEKPMHINALSRALPEERRLAAYHLAPLEERGFVKSRHGTQYQKRRSGERYT